MRPKTKSVVYLAGLERLTGKTRTWNREHSSRPRGSWKIIATRK